MGDVAAQQGVLAGQRHQLGMVALGQHGLAPGRHRRERGGQVDLLEGPRAQDLDVDLAGEGEHRRAVDLGVPQPGHEVGRARVRRSSGTPPGGR